MILSTVRLSNIHTINGIDAALQTFHALELAHGPLHIFSVRRKRNSIMKTIHYCARHIFHNHSDRTAINADLRGRICIFPPP